MPLYEHVFITRQDASAQQVEELTAQFKAIIEQMEPFAMRGRHF